VSAERRFLHDDEASALQMPHDALGGYRGHVLVSLMDALAALESQ
jgi:hypothetical protein